MKRSVLRIVSLLMAIVLSLSSMAISASAEELPQETESAVTEPIQTEPETTESTETEPPMTEPTETEPPTTEPTETEPATTEPTETDPPTTEPPETKPPVTEPPETQPPETQPPEDIGVLTPDGHFIARPSLLEKFDFPDDWSREALEFAVGNEILNGKENGLAPEANTTRAETAAILVRLLGAGDLTVSLKNYTDAAAQAWYYDEMSAAVGIGLVKGTSPTELSPDAPITREQACVLLCRAFGIYPRVESSCDRFVDSEKISKYALYAVNALAEQGYLNGYLDGTVRPQAYITRAEFSKLVYGMVTHICDTPEELPASGRVLYRGSEDIPSGYSLNGSLVIGCGIRGTRTLRNLKTSGRLALRTAQDADIDLLGCTMERLCVPAKVKLYSDLEISQLFTSGSGSSFQLSAGKTYVYGSCTLSKEQDEVICGESGITVTVNDSLSTLRISGDDVQVKVDGTVKTCEIDGTNAVLTVTGGMTDCQISKDSVQAKVDGAVQNCEISGDGVKLTINGSLNDGQLLGDKGVLSGTGTAKNVDIHGMDWEVSKKCDKLTDHIAVAEYNNALSTVETVNNWYNFSLSEPYSKATMEGFVDKKGYSSRTGWLIWASTKTLTVNVFTGSKGNWKLVYTAPCAMGKPSTPTIKGVFDVYYKDNEWLMGGYNCRWVTYFEGGYAFHSRLWEPDYSELLDDSISCLVSAGCVRMYDEDCYYLYKNVPYYSTVVVY